MFNVFRTALITFVVLVTLYQLVAAPAPLPKRPSGRDIPSGDYVLHWDNCTYECTLDRGGWTAAGYGVVWNGYYEWYPKSNTLIIRERVGYSGSFHKYTVKMGDNLTGVASDGTRVWLWRRR